MSKIHVTEEMRPEKDWFGEAKGQTLETLPAFINHIMGDYEHDYGTVCHAVAACALAAAYAANNSENGGITGFQASFVMWDFIRQWEKPNNKTALRLVDYDEMLYPQYAFKFERTISPDVWALLQNEAVKKLGAAANLADGHEVHGAVVDHWKSIAGGKVPFGYTIKED